MSLTYGSYLKLEQLLTLQDLRSDPEEHDELLFIVIHQVYELWFKVLLKEIDKLKLEFSENRTFRAIATLKRARTVMKTLVQMIDILETMTPLSFVSFRDRLETASGFQSWQFRELEFVLGFKRAELISNFPEGSVAQRNLNTRLSERSLVDHFYDFLEHHGAKIPDAVRSKPVTAPTLPNTDVQHSLVQLYRKQEDSALVFEYMTDLDEGMQEWRYRHTKLAERAIGYKRGTGGSTGVDFLKRTLFKPVFPDLWAARSEF